MRRFFMFIVGAALAVSLAEAANITITNSFDPGQSPPAGGPGPVGPGLTLFSGGTTVSALGVTLSYTGSSDGPAMYGGTVGTATYQLAPLTDPVLEGASDGTLTLSFSSPTTFLSFDIVYGVLAGDSSVMVTVDGTPHTFAVPGGFGTDAGLNMGPAFSFGQVSFTPASPFSSAAITFAPDTTGVQFAIDNLSYDTPDPVGAPEPVSVIFLGSGTLLLAALRYRRFSAHA